LKIRKLLKQFVIHIKNIFKLTPEQIHHAENELRSIFGMIPYCKKEKECPGWEWIRIYYPFWQFVNHCPYFRYDGCIMSEEEKKTAIQNLKLVKDSKNFNQINEK
jgi:hypothetical protein